MLSDEFKEEVVVIESILGTENVNYDEDLNILTVQCNVKFQSSSFKVINEFYLETNNETESDYSPNNEFYEQNITYLPTVLLLCKGSENYPLSENLASIHVKSVWLSKKELLLVEKHLESIWSGDPVIFDLISWVQDDMLEYLNIFDEIHISDIDQEYCCDILTRVTIIDKHNRETLFKNFESQMYECSTCFCEFRGTEMILLQCLHTYCNDCIAIYVRVQYTGGRFCAMNCPVCDTFIGRDVIKKLLNTNEFNDWGEKFEKQSIEYNSLVLFCPRCNNYAVQEENLGRCESCAFLFCPLCNNAWHPGSCENFSEHETVYKNQKKNPTDKESQQKKYLKKQVMLSELMMRSFMAQCPKCKCWVMRSYGCNHMKCSLCPTEFCYVCGKSTKLHGFLGYCELEVPNAPFDMNDLSTDQKAFLQKIKGPDAVPPVQNMVIENFPEEKTKCVGCKNSIQRIEYNNHAKCVICKSEFCFLCRMIVKGTNHFSLLGCQQHRGDVKK